MEGADRPHQPRPRGPGFSGGMRYRRRPAADPYSFYWQFQGSIADRNEPRTAGIAGYRRRLEPLARTPLGGSLRPCLFVDLANLSDLGWSYPRITGKYNRERK